MLRVEFMGGGRGVYTRGPCLCCVSSCGIQGRVRVTEACRIIRSDTLNHTIASICEILERIVYWFLEEDVVSIRQGGCSRGRDPRLGKDRRDLLSWQNPMYVNASLSIYVGL